MKLVVWIDIQGLLRGEKRVLPTLGLKAYDGLRKMLAAGELPPGTQLVDRKFADEIGMSMTPRELAQLYDVREALEPVAVVQVFAHIAEHGGRDGRPGDVPPQRLASPRGRPRRVRRGFTLVELLVVIAIIGLLLAMAFPAVQSARATARRLECANNLSQMGKACRVYEDTNKFLPPGSQTDVQLSWRVYILPMIDQQPLYDRIDVNTVGPFNGGTNKEGPNKLIHALNRVALYQCPDATRILATDGSSQLGDKRWPYATHYFSVAGPKGTNPATGQPYPVVNSGVYGGWAQTGLMFRDSRVSSGSVPDGYSNTLMLGESAIANTSSWTSTWWGGGDGGNWVRGGCCENSNPTGTAGSKNVDLGINAAPLLINDLPFASFHIGNGANFARGDGSVDFISENIDIGLYKSMCSRSGGETNATVVPQ